MNVLVLKVNHLGDNVVNVPVVQQLRRSFPHWHLTLVTSPQAAPLYGASLAAEDLLTVPPDAFNQLWKTPARAVSWAARLARRRFDASLIGYDQGSVAHGLARWLGGSPRVGAAGLRIRLRDTLTHRIALQPGWSMARWNWEIARVLVSELDPGAFWPKSPPPPDLAHLTQGMRPTKGRVLVHAGSKQAHTRWPLERFAELAGRLARTFDVVWIETPESAGVTLAENVQRRATPALADLCREIAGAELFVGNNSGPMHLASALGTPGVVLSGPSAFAWDPAWHADRFQVLRILALECLPCEQGPFSPGRCINAAEPMACMQRWSVDEVEGVCLRASKRA